MLLKKKIHFNSDWGWIYSPFTSLVGLFSTLLDPRQLVLIVSDISYFYRGTAKNVFFGKALYLMVWKKFLQICTLSLLKECVKGYNVIIITLFFLGLTINSLQAAKKGSPIFRGICVETRWVHRWAHFMEEKVMLLIFSSCELTCHAHTPSVLWPAHTWKISLVSQCACEVGVLNSWLWGKLRNQEDTWLNISGNLYY